MLALELLSMLVHRRIHAWLQANPFKVDLFQALTATLIFAVPFLLTFQGQQVEFVLSAAICLPLAWKRTRPVAAAAIQAAACLLQLVLVPETGLPADIFVLVTVYSLAAYAPRWASLSGLALALVGGMLFIHRYYFIPLQSGGLIPELTGLLWRYAIIVVAIDAVVLLCWTFGDLARTRRLAMEALRDHARRLEVERQQERDLAAADERTHIAREMHDIVAIPSRSSSPRPTAPGMRAPRIRRSRPRRWEPSRKPAAARCGRCGGCSEFSVVMNSRPPVPCRRWPISPSWWTRSSGQDWR
ncbi:hypothetical protein GCM10017708_38020 [Arthrobacter citreus]